MTDDGTRHEYELKSVSIMLLTCSGSISTVSTFSGCIILFIVQSAVQTYFNIKGSILRSFAVVDGPKYVFLVNKRWKVSEDQDDQDDQESNAATRIRI